MTMETRRMACYRRGARLAMGATTAGPGRGTPRPGGDGRLWGEEALGEQGLGELDLAWSWIVWGIAFCA
jgi:hypothetical protein